MQVAASFVGPAAFERLLDGLTHDELLAEQAHGEIDATADERLAAAGDKARDRTAERVLAVGGDEFPGDHEAPGRRVHKDRFAAAQVRAPVSLADLVADEAVGGRGVGNSQQRFGEAHERHPLLAGERELLHQVIDAACAAALPAYRGDQRARAGANPCRIRIRGFQLLGEPRNAFGLVAPVGARNRVAERAALDRLTRGGAHSAGSLSRRRTYSPCSQLRSEMGEMRSSIEDRNWPASVTEKKTIISNETWFRPRCEAAIAAATPVVPISAT